MAKKRSVWLCQTCALELPAFENPCRNCGTWGSLVETIKEPPRTTRSALRASTDGSGPLPRPLRAAAADRAERLPLGIAELDRVLGGGAVPGSIVLLGGEPGIGKSTLLLQAAAGVAAVGGRVLYATGEESAAQISDRADRLGLMGGPAAEAVEILAEHDAELIGDEFQIVARGLRQRVGIAETVRRSLPAGQRFVLGCDLLQLPDLRDGHAQPGHARALAVPGEIRVAQPELRCALDTLGQLPGDSVRFEFVAKYGF